MSRKILFLILIMLLPGIMTTSRLAPRIVSASTAMPAYSSATSRKVVYENNFDLLALGQTLPFPGAPGQNRWFSELAEAPAYGEIQDTIVQAGHALHEFTSSSVPGLPQTIDKRFINPPNLSLHSLITLQVDFYAHTSDLEAENVYAAHLTINGGPHPGFEILGFSLNSGNGEPKGVAGVNVGLSHFNGVNNNDLIPLSVGQGLAWDTWHSLTLLADQATDRYISLTVDGETEDLSAYSLPRSELSLGVWERGQLMEEILVQVVPNIGFGDETEDDIYWDNLRLIVEGGYQVYLPVVLAKKTRPDPKKF